jgi:hypothetical protein
MPSRDSPVIQGGAVRRDWLDSMLPPLRSGAYVSGTVLGPMTTGAGSALPCERTRTVGVPISVTDRFEVVATESPLDSG